MKKQLTASITHEPPWFVAQCLEVDIASQGQSVDEALANLTEALELHFEEPRPTAEPIIRSVEIEVGAA